MHDLGVLPKGTESIQMTHTVMTSVVVDEPFQVLQGRLPIGAAMIAETMVPSPVPPHNSGMPVRLDGPGDMVDGFDF